MLIDFLDRILLYIRSQSKAATENDIGRTLSQEELAYLEKAIQHLEKDGYIYTERTSNNNTNSVRAKITFEGLLFLEQGGYKGALEQANQQSSRLASLEIRQARTARRLFYINLVIAVGAAFAVLWYIIDVALRLCGE